MPTLPENADFKDYFSSFASGYTAARPGYPDSLFQFVASRAPSQQRVWDCATGNGQAAVGLCRVFDEVHATDASAEQIGNAIHRKNIEYSVQLAEETNFPDNHFDAVTVAQALHWFQLDLFCNELARVLKPNGLLVAWVYGFFSVSPEIDAVIDEELKNPIEHLWKKGNWVAKSGYADIELPFPRIDVPEIEMECRWNLAETVNYVSTWSAVNRYIEENGKGIIERTAEKLSLVWGDPAEKRQIFMDFFVLAWRR